MPHWDLDGMVLDRLQLELARAVAPEQEFHPQDAGRLVAIGRAIGNLARLAWDDPDFQVRLNETRLQFTNQVTGVLMEANEEAGRPRAGRRPDRGAGPRLRRPPALARRLGPSGGKPGAAGGATARERRM